MLYIAAGEKPDSIMISLMIDRCCLRVSAACTALALCVQLNDGNVDVTAWDVMPSDLKGWCYTGSDI